MCFFYLLLHHGTVVAINVNWVDEFQSWTFQPCHFFAKGRLSYHLCVECFSQLSFDSEVYTKSAAVADFVYTSESNESCEKHSTQR